MSFWSHSPYRLLKSSSFQAVRPGQQNNRKSTAGKRGGKDPGGAWQAFLAWVPTGAAMQNPEPWRLGEHLLVGSESEVR